MGADLALARSQQASRLKAFKKDLSGAKAASANSLNAAKKLFASKATTLTNAIAAAQHAYKRGMEKVTGLKDDWEKTSASDRKDVRAVRDSMDANLNKDIARAIQIGEARAKQVESTAMANIETAKKALLTTISESVENMADNVFAAVQGNRQKIADNYLSLKAYAATAADKVTDYLAKGKGRNLSSIGDLLNTIAATSDVKVKAASGEGFGADKIQTLFSDKDIKVDNSISKINGLVNEYVSLWAR